MKTIKPANNQLFCKPDDPEVKTKSGFILAESTVSKPLTANVINVGKDVTGFKQNDKIIYKAYTTTEIKLDHEDYILLAEEDVLGTVIEV